MSYYWTLAAFGTGTLTGAAASSIIFWGMFRRLAARLARRDALAATASDLQTRREIHDFGRDEQVRPDAGEPVIVREAISVTRPGALSLYNTRKSPGENA